jgi:hypothetical protein
VFHGAAGARPSRSLLHDVAAACDIVGLAIAEYMPWEAIATRNLLRKLPLLAGYE